VENEIRTAAYHAAIAARTAELQQTFADLFPGSTEFVWELGSGHGHFLNAYAAAHPEKLCVGVDIESARVDRAIRKRDRAGLKNLHFIRADARHFLRVLPESAKISDLFILFPDPWPKSRHHKHRILQPGFLAAVGERMTPNARLFFRTDHDAYFRAALKVVADQPAWSLVDEPWGFEFETIFQSRAAKFHSFIARRR
jgi:tRNA (guanine-N7-)-methyltransferase